MAIEADNRIGPLANIGEENVDSDSEARPREVSSGQYKVLATIKKRGRKKENSAIECAAGTGLVSFDFRLFSPPWRNTSRQKDRKTYWRSLLLPLYFFRLLFFLFLAACPNGSRTNKSL